MIEFLFWEGCPSHERALSRLREQMTALGIPESELTIREVLAESDAERDQFIGSPTIRVDGTDIASPGDNAVGLNCRVYQLRDGRISPLPDPDDLKEALANYARKGK